MGRQFCLQIAKVFGGQQTNLHPGGLELGSYQVHQRSAEAPLESKKKRLLEILLYYSGVRLSIYIIRK